MYLNDTKADAPRGTVPAGRAHASPSGPEVHEYKTLPAIRMRNGNGSPTPKNPVTDYGTQAYKIRLGR